MRKKLFLLCLALAFLLSACGASPAVPEGKTDPLPERHQADPVPKGETAATPEPAAEATSEPTPEPTPEATAAAEAVVTAFSLEGDYRDDVGNEYHYLYRIPAFTCGSADAEAMNERARSFVNDLIGDDLQNIEEERGYSLLSSLADYEVYENGDLLSVVVSVHNEWGQTAYCVLNLDTWTQREAGRDSVLAAAGTNPASFLERAAEAAGEAFGGFPELSGDLQQFAEDQYKKTVMEENLQDTQLFINGEGKLCMIVRVFSLAGADYYWRIVEL